MALRLFHRLGRINRTIAQCDVKDDTGLYVLKFPEKTKRLGLYRFSSNAKLPRMTLSEHRRGTLVGVIVASLCVLILTLVVLQFPGGPSVETLHTTETYPIVSSVHGGVPYLAVSPQNHTFTLQYSITAYQYPITLSYDSSSYLMQYTNGTTWLSFSRPCSTDNSSQTGKSSASSASIIQGSLSASHGVPCGEPPGSGWSATNGSLVDGHIALTNSDLEVTIAPVSLSPGQTELVNITVSITLAPGVYAVNLVIDTSASNSQTMAYNLGPIPVVVTG